MQTSHNAAAYPTDRQGAAKSRKNQSGQPQADPLSSYVFGKVQPQAVPLEEAVLGALMLDREALPMVEDVLRPESFYLDAHKLIFAAAQRLHARSQPIDLLTMTEEMRTAGDLEKVAGGYRLVELSSIVASAANIEYHSRIIAQKHMMRQMIETCTTIIRDAYEDTTDAFDLLDRLEKEVFEIAKGVQSQAMVPVGSTVLKVLEHIEAAQEAAKKQQIVGVPSGIAGIDEKTGGFRPGSLIVVGARPAMGKTAWTLGMAIHAASKGFPVALFSLEMGKEEITERLIAHIAEVSGKKIRNGGLDDADWQAIGHAAELVMALPIHLDDTAAISLAELRSKARRAVRKHGVKVVMIDYLGLMGNSSEKSGFNREQEVAKLSKGLKNLAKELAVPIVVLSQLSRAVETRGGAKRPQLSDLRESGSVEQDADIAAFLYRPEYYQIFEDENGDNCRDMGEFIIAKHRHGEVGTVKMRWTAEYAKYSDLRNNSFEKSVANKKPNALSLHQNPAADPNSDARFPADETAAIMRANRLKADDIPF